MTTMYPSRTVSLNALVGRINRKLAKECWPKKLCKSRGWRQQQDLGDWYVLNILRNSIHDARLTTEHLVDMATELGVLAQWESLAEDEITIPA